MKGLWTCVCVFSLLLGGRGTFASSLEMEELVRRDVLKQGLSLGYDGAGGTCLAIASASRSLATNADEEVSSRVRDVCFRMAELRARHQIMNALGLSAQGIGEVERSAIQGHVSKMVRSVFETFSQRAIRGCECVAFHELRQNGRLSVAVAFKWSRSLEEREESSLRGLVPVSPQWQEEFRIHIGSRANASWPPMMLFADSAGHVHHIGVGTSIARGASPLRRDAAIKTAELFARGHFQQLLDGNAEVQKNVQALLASGLTNGSSCRSTGAFFEALGKLQASGALPRGACEIHLANRPISDGMGTVWISFFGM